MGNKIVHARNMFSVPATALSEFFKMSFLAAVGARFASGETPMFVLDGLPYTSFWPCERLWFLVCPGAPSASRIIVSLRQKTNSQNAAGAICRIEQEFCPRRNGGCGHLTVDVVFPDMILGLERMVQTGAETPYRGLFFNSTVDEHRANLYDLIDVVSKAFAQELTAHIASSASIQTAAAA